MKKAAVIGAGIGGIASAIRLALKGYEIHVYEKNSFPGGKLSEIHLDGYRFDAGPSLFTLPKLVTELFELAGEEPSEHFKYEPLDIICKYFYEDGTIVNAYNQPEKFAAELEEKVGEPASNVLRFLQNTKELYDLTSEIFMFNSFHKLSNYLKPAYKNTLLHLPKLHAFTTMAKRNERLFESPKVQQLFNRYATYNGSDPYKAPATLNLISHLEHNIGAFFPEKGMYSIALSLWSLAERQGVVFHFNKRVKNIIIENGKASGLKVDNEIYDYPIIINDVDIAYFYKDLLPDKKRLRRLLKKDRSCSAMIFYWGMDKKFDGLELHNIFFSADYKKEFDYIFEKKDIYEDPTAYVFISSRQVPSDAPAGKDNWFVMINVPENTGQDWNHLVAKTRKNTIKKIERNLGLEVGKHIVAEKVLNPVSIDERTGSYNGALYGSSSNGMMAAFNRHPNFRRGIKGLYFVGGSVHPGGGIPLCISSAKIIDQEIPKQT
jgi:phytoene desaturase